MITPTTYTLDDAESDARQLSHLIDTAVDALIERVGRANMPTDDVAELDRIESLLWISRDLAAALAERLRERPASPIHDLARSLTSARAAWLAVDPDGNCNGPEWAAYSAAEGAFFWAPCQTIEDAQAKAELILREDHLFDTLLTCCVGDVHVAKMLLRSLIGGAKS